MPYFDTSINIPSPQRGDSVDVKDVDRWNDLIQNKLEQDTDTGVKAVDFVQNGKLFFLSGDNERLEPLVNDENPFFRGGLQLSHAREGRLFVRDGDHLRQVQTPKEGETFTIALSVAFSNFTKIEAPERPSFWKYILYPLFADEIALYNQQRDVYNTLTSTETVELFNSARQGLLHNEDEEPQEELSQQINQELVNEQLIENEQPELNEEQKEEQKEEQEEKLEGEEKQVEGEEKQAEGEEKQVEEEEKQVEEENLEAKPQGGLKTGGKKGESVKDFLEKVEGAAERNTDITNLLKQSRVTQNTVVEYFYRIAEERAAQNLLRSVENHPDGRDNAIMEHMDAYNAMLEGVRKMLPEMIGEETMQEIIRYEWKDEEVENFDMLDKCNELAENTLNKYNESLIKENEESAKSMAKKDLAEEEATNEQAMVMGGM